MVVLRCPVESSGSPSGRAGSGPRTATAREEVYETAPHVVNRDVPGAVASLGYDYDADTAGVSPLGA